MIDAGVILLSILVTFWITLVITESDGPFGIFERFRNIEFISSFGLFNCFVCVSFWVGFLVASVTSLAPDEWLFYALAYAGGATALERLSIARL